MKPGDLVAIGSSVWSSTGECLFLEEEHVSGIATFVSEDHCFEDIPEFGLDVPQDKFYCTVLHRGRSAMAVADKLRKL